MHNSPVAKWHDGECISDFCITIGPSIVHSPVFATGLNSKENSNNTTVSSRALFSPS
jgi:hypothetical protein